MAITSQTYNGDGSTTAFTFTVPYIDTSDVKAEIGGVATTAFSVSGTTVTFNTAPASGTSNIKIFRLTNNDTIKANFQSGSALRAQDFNDNFLQFQYVTQESKTVADEAKTDSETANTNATAAQTAATNSAASATAAQTSATAAQASAASASSDASTAVSTANTASSTANTALSTANTASTNATTAVNTANTASTNATTALNNSRESDGAGGFNTAISIANTASTNASSAVSTANTASTNASTALSTANTASSTASTALSTANTADTNASSAVTTANTANTNASAAQTAASNAATDASSAQTSATAAQTSATSAQNSATAAAASAAASQNVADAFTATGTPATALSVDVPIHAANGVKLPTNSNSYDEEGAIRYNTTLDKIEIRKGSGWSTAAGGATVSSTPPSLATAGDVWYDHDNGRAYVYYNDGDSNQWVEMNPSWNGYVSDNSVTSAKIVDGTIVNADINASAAIAGTKINPNFGSQNVLTTGDVGVGNTSPDTTLRVTASAVNKDAQTNDIAVFERNDNGYVKIYNANNKTGGLAFGDVDDNFIGAIRYDHSDDNLNFYVNNSERMRIDSSGNLGVGTTAPDTILHAHAGSAGSVSAISGTVITAENSGNAFVSILSPDANVGALVYGSPSNTNNASINGYYNGGSQYLNLNVAGSEAMRIDSSGDVELMQGNNLTWVFAGGSTHRARIRAESSDALIFENGSSNAERMRILSDGGLTFNGDTAQANALDDYEEGTYTPYLADGNSSLSGITYNIRYGFYRKVGRIVYISAYIAWTARTNTSSSAALISLPFQSNTATYYRGSMHVATHNCTYYDYDFSGSSNRNIGAMAGTHISNSTSFMQLSFVGKNNGSWASDGIRVNGLGASGGSVQVSGTYMT